MDDPSLAEHSQSLINTFHSYKSQHWQVYTTKSFSFQNCQQYKLMGLNTHIKKIV